MEYLLYFFLITTDLRPSCVNGSFTVVNPDWLIEPVTAQPVKAKRKKHKRHVSQCINGSFYMPALTMINQAIKSWH